ncbi:MAG TPA: hypothetical protein VFY29_07220, partial [Terriglobia bacterium]|nr:hypothetical protein [Terriglobia bacterium]
DVLSEFRFATPSDESRAMASIITPAMVRGGFIRGNTPLQGAEADDSQAGKGYFQKICRAIYWESGYAVTKKDGGVGSLDESISAALVSGSSFIALDNVRQSVNSQFLESILTAGKDKVPARVPHRGEILVDVRHVTFQLSSNGAEMTRDLANRSLIVRIRKQPRGYQFRRDVLGDVEANRAEYLGAVFSVVRQWAAAGCPSIPGQHHDFREWAGALAWIIENIFHLPPMLDGHEAAKERVSNPALGWLRAVCLAVANRGMLDQELSASMVAEFCEDDGVDLPGLRTPAEDGQSRKYVGKLFARCFTGTDQVEIDEFRVHRTECEELSDRKTITVRRYRFLRTVRTVRTEPTTSGEVGLSHIGSDLSPHTPQSASSNDTPPDNEYRQTLREFQSAHERGELL